ncbi:hypothetical protein [Novosphingobium beihaiensis]|uniref:Uncharacterized protein n=1 Tax=Novosphingobium beihaiensis TaxID=2930389 RepID=A0ABT0BQ60_9SPHN|nr:hypothetical protein [Novosphingobium beihaiensis]MCJ2187095.1 hypothetical protein [Novosphingobium beihaiensis]
MSGSGRRLIGIWVAVAIVLVVALGLFKGEPSGSEAQQAARSEIWTAGPNTVVVRILGPVLY